MTDVEIKSWQKILCGTNCIPERMDTGTVETAEGMEFVQQDHMRLYSHSFQCYRCKECQSKTRSSFLFSTTAKTETFLRKISTLETILQNHAQYVK